MKASQSAPASPAAHTAHAATCQGNNDMALAHCSSTGNAMGTTPPRVAITAGTATATTTTWAAGNVGPASALHSASIGHCPELMRSDSPVTLLSPTQQMQHQDNASCFQSGVKHAGWLWKRFGHGHKTKWKRLWFYLEDDRLCYCRLDKLIDSSSNGTSSARLAGSGISGVDGSLASTSYSLRSTAAAWQSSTAGSAAALAAGQIKYIALDRIPVRPLPQRQHGMDPLRKSHPDIGVAIIDARVLTGQPTDSPQRTVFSLVAGSHTYYLAAETMRDAQLWVSALRETWLHCFSHTARRTTNGSSGMVMSQRLMAENAQLRESIQELNQKVSQSDYEYWRKWVEEKAKNQVLESKLVNAATYEILVKTGSVKGASTDARVYVELYGPDFCPDARHLAAASADCCGCSGEVRLFDIDSKSKPFQKNALDNFTVVCNNVGLPAKLKVWHDNTGCQPDWFLTDIKVRKKGAKDWVCFPCNRWLSTQLDDGRICRELIAGASRSQVTYQVVTCTSDIRGAGTDAAVFVQLHGLLGDGLKQQLLGGPKDFERGARNDFLLEDADLGELTAVTVSHDGSGKNPAWHLDHVEVTPLACLLNNGSYGRQSDSAMCASKSSPTPSRCSTPQSQMKTRTMQLHMSSSMPLSQSLDRGLRVSGSMRTGQGTIQERGVYLFPCNAWLDERLGDGKTERRLQAASALTSKVWYNLHITTSDVRGAGTDADVHVMLMGSEGNSENVQLPSKPEHFERGCRDTFRLQLPYVGSLQKLLIGHNGRGDSPSWHLALVEVVEEESNRVTYFAADRWLGVASGDGMSEVTLTASSSDPRKALVDYKVCFVTSSLRGAGTDSTVSFELYGDRGSSGVITVACGTEAFERGGRDVFTYTRPWLGQLQKIVVWHDNGGAAAGQGPWHLEAVEVACSKEEQVITFPCGKWLSAKTQLRVELQQGRTTGLTRYRFDVVTSNVRGAGTDGALLVQLNGLGPAGTTTTAGPWCLDRSAAFARDSTDSFIVEGVEIVKPSQLQVSLQGASLNPDWHLNYVVCTILTGEGDEDGIKYYFVAERWFDAVHGLTATLACSTKPPGKPGDGQLPYAVKFYTSNLKGAGTDANISVNITGLKGSSGWQQLQARQETFERGQEDTFTLKLPDLGPLTHLAVKSDGSGEGPAWHLDKVCIIPPAINNGHLGPGRTAAGAGSQIVSGAASVPIALGAAPQGSGGSVPVGNAVSQPGALGATTGQNGQPVWFVARRWLDAVHGLEVLLEAQSIDPAKSLVTYKVEVFTAELKNAGTDACVMIQVVGDKATSAPVELQDPTSPAGCFLRGGADAFTLRLQQLGQLSKARVWLEGPGSPWRVKLIIITGPDGDITYFPCGAWLRLNSRSAGSSPVLGSAAQPLEIQATKQDPRQHMREYKVVTRTSDIPGAATDAAVYVELRGATGVNSDVQQLVSATPQAFDRGSVDEFSFMCEHLGELAQLRIGHDGSGSRPAWHLLQVEVTDVAAQRTWFFEADCWLDASQGDGRTERLLTASLTDPLTDLSTYRVTVYTSKKQGASTGGLVHITLQGSKGPPVTCTSGSSNGGGLRPKQQQAAVAPATPSTGNSAVTSSRLRSSGRHHLKSSNRNAFIEGGIGTFTLPAMRSLGQLRQLILELKSTTAESCSWHGQHLEVTCTNTGECWLFPCNSWLAVSGNMPQKVVLYPAPDLNAMWQQLQQEQEQEQEEYKVTVYTSDISGAGTNASVAAILYGAAGEAGPFQLSSPGHDCFERGSCDVFNVQTASKLGKLHKLKVVTNTAGLGSAWHLDTISITAKSTGKTMWFYAGRWFNRTVGLEAVFQADEADTRQQLVLYKITTHTGDVHGAGTDARVFVDIRGSSGTSGPQELFRPSGNSHSNCFEQKQADSFELRCRDLGPLVQLEVWHDNSGLAAGWNLGYIDVQHVQSGQVWYFPCGQWLDSTRGDKATRRTLKATSDFDPASLQCSYRIIVTTGNVRGAGTDANVSMVIHGSKGETGRIALARLGRNCFERGQRDEFKVCGADVGEMSHIMIGHDGSGLGPAWYLAEVEVQHLGTGQILKLTANRWLDAKRGGSLECELRPEQQSGAVLETYSMKPVNWELLVITGKVLGAGTDADVFISLKGSSTTYGPYTLPAGPEAFETGCKDTFKLSTPDIGDLQEVIVGHNNMGNGAAWFLEGLELLNLNTGTKYVFKVAAWLDIQNGCCRTLKPLPQPPQPLLSEAQARAPSTCSYQMEIQTSNVDGAGTDAAVFVQLRGMDGESDAVQLQAASGNGALTTRALFDRGSLDVFILRGLPCLGSLTQLTIGHDDSGTHPAWHLAWVRVVNLTTSSRAMFIANAWLDSSLPGSNNWVVLQAGSDNSTAGSSTAAAPGSTQQPGQIAGPSLFTATAAKGQTDSVSGALKLRKSLVHTSILGQPGYKVTFVTSNIIGAGTNAKVFFELVGEHGSSGVVYASSQSGQFARGHNDSFLYPRLPYLGQLYQLRVGCDGTGMFAPWHLRQVEVVHVHTGQKWMFDCHEWIDKKCTWQRILSAAPVAAAM